MRFLLIALLCALSHAQTDCTATATWVPDEGKQKKVKGVAAFTQRNKGKEPGYLFSMVDETTCMRDITVVNQDMATRATVRTPVPLDNWDKVATWSFVNGGPGSFMDRKVQDESCKWKQTGAQAYDGDKCRSETDDRGIFKVSGNCKVQKNKNLNCVGSPNYPDDFTASEQICVATMLKDATVRVSESSGISDDCAPVVFAQKDKRESRVTDIDWIPDKVGAGDYIKWHPMYDCPGWQLCFVEEGSNTEEESNEDPCAKKEDKFMAAFGSKDNHCPYWKGQGFCSDQYAKWMSIYCAKTCCTVESDLEAELSEIDRLKKVNSALRIALGTLVD